MAQSPFPFPLPTLFMYHMPSLLSPSHCVYVSHAPVSFPLPTPHCVDVSHAPVSFPLPTPHCVYLSHAPVSFPLPTSHCVDLLQARSRWLAGLCMPSAEQLTSCGMSTVLHFLGHVRHHYHIATRITCPELSGLQDEHLVDILLSFKHTE